MLPVWQLFCRCGGMADALDSGSSGCEARAGSTPVICTKQ